MIRYWLLIAVRTRALLAPALAVAFVLAGVFAYKPNEPASTWALTGLLAFPLCGWIVLAAAHAEPEPAREMRIAALGGAWPGVIAEARWALAVAAVVGALCIAYPPAIGAFTPPAGTGDVLRGTAGHLASGTAGAALGLLAATWGLGTGAALVIAATLASLAAEPALGVLSGPAGVADALADRRTGALVAACAACIVWATGFGGLAGRRRAR